MKLLKLSAIVFLFAVITGCASIAGDNSRRVSVNSHPQGAAIYVDNQRYGTTPAIITLPSYIYGGKSVTLKKPGYQDNTMIVNSKFQPVAILDIFAPITFLIDGATGNLVKIDPANTNLHAQLQRA